MIELSRETRSRIARIAADADGKAVVLDPADEGHRALITTLLNASGKGPDRYPALHRAVAAAGDGGISAANGSDHDATIVDLGRDSAGRATSRTWIASRGGAYISGAATVLLDAETEEVLASGTATQVGGNLVQVSTRTAEAQPASERVTAATFYHAQATPDAAPSFGMVATTRDTMQQGLQINVKDPYPVKHPGAKVTVIGLSRPSYAPDCDYTYAQPSSGANPDRLAVPFTGSASLPYEVASVTNPVAVITRLYVTSAKAWTNPVSGFNLLGSVTAKGYDVTWSYPPDGKTVIQTASIQYQMKSQANDTISDFFYQFQVRVQSLSQPVITFTVCSDDTPDEPSINCVKVRDIKFWWHCMGADTRVTLADGREVPIEEVDHTCVVRTGQGAGTGAVQATSRATHDDDDDRQPALRLRTGSGRSLLLSDGHPVVTPEGPIAARDLRPGDEVVTVDGIDRVASCGPEPYDGIVYNLKLEEADGRPFGSFLANGIAVGDHDAQAAYHQATRHDPAYVLPRIPETHHQDWLSALADATAR